MVHNEYQWFLAVNSGWLSGKTSRPRHVGRETHSQMGKNTMLINPWTTILWFSVKAHILMQMFTPRTLSSIGFHIPKEMNIQYRTRFEDGHYQIK